MSDQVRVQIIFTKREAGYPEYTDALYFGLEEYEQKTEQEIEAMKTERFNNFKNIIDNSVEVEEELIPEE